MKVNPLVCDLSKDFFFHNMGYDELISVMKFQWFHEMKGQCFEVGKVATVDSRYLEYSVSRGFFHISNKYLRPLANN